MELVAETDVRIPMWAQISLYTSDGDNQLGLSGAEVRWVLSTELVATGPCGHSGELLISSRLTYVMDGGDPMCAATSPATLWGTCP